jgi:Tir chaperone family protein CesT
MVHGAFGLEGDSVVIVHALELENLDLNEFQAVIDDMTMAVVKHQPILSRYLGPASATIGAH